MDKGKELAKIAIGISKCRRCPLYKSATNPVAGGDSANAKIVFIGEAPGFYEDQAGRPFVGSAGQLLNQHLELVKLRREEVFITNIIKHRPPQNRDPQPAEIAACNIWLDQQLAVIQPKIIVTLGRFSLAKFLPQRSITKIHGKAFKVGNFTILPLFHPAAALRSQEIEKQLGEDFQKIPTLLYSDSAVRGDNDTAESRQKSDQLNLL